MTQIDLSNRTKRKGEKLNNYKYGSVSTLNTKVDRFLDQYHQFKIKYSVTPQAKIRKQWNVAVSGMLIRQVQTLDAIRAVSMSGRPHAAYILLRHIYEVYMDLLLMGFHDETIEIPHNPRGKKTQRLRWTKKNLAICYFHFRFHAHIQDFNYFYSNDEEKFREEVGLDKKKFNQNRDRRQRYVKRIRDLHGWNEKTNDWRPMSIGALRDHLWSGGNPLFP